MCEFDYMNLKERSWDGEILSLIAQIREHKGRQELFLRLKPDEPERLVEVAKIRSTDSSNKIEGIGTSDARMKQLMEHRTEPRTRDEQEITGYRDVLNTIHESYEYIPLKGDVILQLHRDLLSYTDKAFGGMFKNTQNYINEIHADGGSVTRFIPLEPFETPMAVEAICRSYCDARAKQVVDTLILIPIFICDFLCIHPFNDGNGRISRLLTTLLLYQSGFMVGRYISIEEKIERTKDTYYNILRIVSSLWYQGGNDYTPFIKYFLGILLNSYRDLEDRLGAVDRKSSPYEIVRNAVDSTLGLFTKAQILDLCPSIRSSSVEAALKRLKDEGYIRSQGRGRSTAYVRDPII